MSINDLLPYLPVLALVVAIVGIVLRWRSDRAKLGEERARNQTLEKQLTVAEEHLALASPHSDVRIGPIVPTGGSDGRLSFYVEVQNVGTRPTRAFVEASIAGKALPVHSSPDLLVNESPTRVHFDVPRPELGDLMRECEVV